MVGLSFLKKKKATTGIGRVPIERVKELSAHGFSEPDIIDVLRKEGYSPREIDQALTEALKSTVDKEKRPQPTESALPTLDQLAQPKKLEMPEQPLPDEYYQYSAEDYANYIDSLIQARVSEVTDEMAKLSVKYQDLEKKIAEINQEIKEMSKSKTTEQMELLKKIESFRDSIDDINTRVGGLEKAFKETLPALIESVRMLSDLVHKVKREI